MNTWSTTRIPPSPIIVAFACRLSTLLLKDEENFKRLNTDNFLIKLINGVKIRLSLKSSYIQLLSSFLEHQSGVEWMAACNFWEDVLSLTLSTDCVVVDESCQFLAKLLEATVDCDEDFCDSVVKKIMVSLGENVYRCVKTAVDVSDEYFRPSLKLIGGVLEYFLKGVLEGKDFGVLLIFLKNFRLEERICDFMIIARSKTLVFDLSKIMFVMQFLEVYGKIITNTTTLTQVYSALDRIQNNFVSTFSRGCVLQEVAFCDFGLLFWKVVQSKIPTKTNLVDALVVLLTMPHYCLLTKYLLTIKETEEETDNDDFQDAFVGKALKMISRDFMRVCVSWRDNLDDVDLFELCVRSFNVIKQRRQYLTKSQAVFFFQSLIYFVKGLISSVQRSFEKVELFVAKWSFVCEIFELVGVLIDSFRIGLKDAIETTYVMTFCFDFVALTEWCPEVVVEVVKLVNVAVNHYMAPDMALLVENSSDPTLALLGPFLYSKLLDEGSRVKKTALDVVRTAAAISNHSKF